jgi:hypothetical protein
MEVGRMIEHSGRSSLNELARLRHDEIGRGRRIQIEIGEY